jgi:hypothetical protein
LASYGEEVEVLIMSLNRTRRIPVALTNAQALYALSQRFQGRLMASGAPFRSPNMRFQLANA